MAELKTCLRCEKQNKITAPSCEWCGFDLSATEKPTGVDAISVGRQDPAFYYIRSAITLFMALPFGMVMLIFSIKAAEAQREQDFLRAEWFFRAADITLNALIGIVGVSVALIIGMMLFTL